MGCPGFEFYVEGFTSISSVDNFGFLIGVLDGSSMKFLGIKQDHNI